MADLCNVCKKIIEDDFEKITDEKEGNRMYTFHSDCFDVEKFSED